MTRDDSSWGRKGKEKKTWPEWIEEVLRVKTRYFRVEKSAE